MVDSLNLRLYKFPMEPSGLLMNMMEVKRLKKNIEAGSIKLKIPISSFEQSDEPMDLNTKSMCSTCAYRISPTKEEDEMTIAYWHEKPVPHRCHERLGNKVCKGALKSFERLGLEISQ